MTAQIVLVRHAMPVIEPELPAERWQLGDEGRAAARELAHALPRAPFAVTSDEPKALETAEELVAVCGGTLTVDARVTETRRPQGWDANFARCLGGHVGRGARGGVGFCYRSGP